MIFTGSTIFVGNIYYGFQLAHYSKNRSNIIGGFVYGGIKVLLYSPLSWVFQLYALDNHINGMSPTMRYKFHLIPNSIKRYEGYGMEYKEFFKREGL